jgi:SAM-dependent methyltransferase
MRPATGILNPVSDDPYTLDWARWAPRLSTAALSDQAWYIAVATALVRGTDRVAVDVGCGGGGMSAALAAMLGRAGRIVAVDSSPEVLDAAANTVATLGTDEAAAVSYVLDDLDGDLGAVAASADGADLVWASASVHHAGDQQAAVTALAGLLSPGGRLALAEGGLPPRHLPWDLGVGTAGLELRLIAAQDRWFAAMRAELPQSTPMPYGWTSALERAGLIEVGTNSWLLERSAPLATRARTYVLDQVAHRVDRLLPSGLLSAADTAAWERLLDPGDDAWLGHRDDLYHLEVRSVHLGTRP